jgi:hypothetical protein
MMIKPEQIPDAVIKVFRAAWMDADKTTEAAIAAAINAWPGVHTSNHYEWMKSGELASFDIILPVILPLPQEKNND